MLKKYFSIDRSLFTVESSMGTLKLFSLLFPILFENVMLNLQGTVNTAVLSNYSETAVAAVGAANTLVSVITLIGVVISMGATVVISNSIGEGRAKKTSELTFTAVVMSLSVALVITPILVLTSRNLMLMLNLDGEILDSATTYFRIRMAFLVFSMLTSSILAILRCYGFPKYTFLIGIITNTLNLIFNIYVIHFPQYSPVTGVSGVAYSACISNLIGLIVAVFIIGKMKIRVERPKTIARLFRYIKSMLRIGVPSGLSSMSFTFSQMITTSFVALIGAYALSAKVYYTNILGYVYLFSASAGNANALMVGRCYGAGELEKAEKMNAQLVKITTVVNLAISLFVLIFNRQLLGLFTSDALVFKFAIGVFAIDIITEQARAVSQVYEYALRAVGDVLFSTVILIISCWVCSIGLAYFLAIKCGMGLIGCWIGLATDESIRAIVTYLRWKSGRWKYKT